MYIPCPRLVDTDNYSHRYGATHRPCQAQRCPIAKIQGGETGLTGFLVTAFFATALDTAPNLLADLFNEEWGTASRTGLVDGTIP